MATMDKERLENRYKTMVDVPDRRGHDEKSLREQAGRTPDLDAQTPGLDADRPAVLIGLRAFSWIRERPEVAAIVAGCVGLCALGIGLGVHFAKPRWRRRLDSLLGW